MGENEEWTFAAKQQEKVKIFRKWCFTLNVDLLDNGRLKDESYYVEGQNTTESINCHNKSTRTTVWIGALEPKEYDKTKPYAHRHCAVECTSGGITKMNAINIMAKFLQLPPSTLTCGEGNVVCYAQQVKDWPAYKMYMFKTLPGRMTSQEEKIQQAVIHLRRSLKKNPQAKEVKEYIVKNNILSFSKVATAQVRQQIELACEIENIYKSDESVEGSDDSDKDDGIKFLSKLAKLDDPETQVIISAGFFDDILDILVKQISKANLLGNGPPPLRRVFEIIALLILPLFVKRNCNDHQTKSLVFYGLSKTGKSFIQMCLVKAGKLHQVCSDAKGVGRYDMSTSCNGFFFDDVDPKLLTTGDVPTIKNLTGGDEASVKVYSKSTTVRGWVYITCQTELLKLPEDIKQGAWYRRLIELCFDSCEQFKEYTTYFDIVKRSNIDEMLTFLYYVIHKPKMNCETVLKDFIIKSDYYDGIISNMFNKLKYGTNLLRLLNMRIVKYEQDALLNQ